MKNILLFLLLALYSYCSSQSNINWQMPVQVSASSYDNLHPRVVTDRAGNPIIIWGKLSNDKVYFSRWDGNAFTMPVALNPHMVPVFTASWAGPDIASFGDTVYVVYKQEPEDTGHIYSVASYNGGVNFSMPVRVDYTADSGSRFPSITAGSNGSPIIAFMKFDPGFGNPRYVVAKSNDYGVSYQADVPASGYSGGEVCDCCPASIICDDSLSVLMYRDNLNNKRNMWTGISTDYGNSFPGSLQMDFTNWMINSCPSSGPDGVIFGDSLYMVYMSKATGKETVYFSKASLVTRLATTDMPVPGNVSGVMSQNFPRIANFGNTVAAVWRQTTMSDDQVALSFTRNITSGLPALYDTVAMGDIMDADVTLSDTTIHIVWEDNNTGTVMYRKGTFTEDTAVVSAIVTELNDYRIQIFPNPASDAFVIRWDAGLNIKTAELTDITGKQVIFKAINETNQELIDVSNLASGVYTLCVKFNLHNSVYKKLVIR